MNDEILKIDFSEALEALKEGFKVTRASWPKGQVLVLDQDIKEGEEVADPKFLVKENAEAVGTPYTFSYNDLLADDWYAIKEEVKDETAG